jgi:hypothetical protein
MAEEIIKEEQVEEDLTGGDTGEGEGKDKSREDALAGALQAVAEKNARIGALEAEVQALQAAGETLVANLDEAKKAAAAAENRGTEFQGIALAKYREALIEGHPDIPSQLIHGSSIEELYSSVDAGKEVVAQIREGLREEVGAVVVPAGSPERSGIKLEGMSAREKIAAGINNKEGG